MGFAFNPLRPPLPMPRSSSTASATRDNQADDMGGTKLSPALKALINAPFAKPGPCPAPSKMHDVYSKIARDAAKHKLGHRPWVVISVRRALQPPQNGLELLADIHCFLY